jgi:hypothetical protein
LFEIICSQQKFSKVPPYANTMPKKPKQVVSKDYKCDIRGDLFLVIPTYQAIQESQASEKLKNAMPKMLNF